jgi:hypothetical protein
MGVVQNIVEWDRDMCGLFNSTLSVETMASDRRMTGKLEKIWKEEVICLEGLSKIKNLPGSGCIGCDSNQANPKYKFRALALDQPV